MNNRIYMLIGASLSFLLAVSVNANNGRNIQSVAREPVARGVQQQQQQQKQQQKQKQKQKQQQKQKQKQKQKQYFTKGHYDTNLSAKVFNWNNGEIKNIALDSNRPLKTQYISSLPRYFKQVASKHGTSSRAEASNLLAEIHNTGRGGIIARYKQKIDEMEVFGRSINILINRKNEYIASSGYFSPVKKKPIARYRIDQPTALANAFFANTGKNIDSGSLILISTKNSFDSLIEPVKSDEFSLSKNSRVKKVYFPLASGALISAYYVEAETSIQDRQTSKWFSYIIDGQTGKVLFRNNLTADVATTYTVFADPTGAKTPFDGPQGNALTPHPTGNLADTPAVGETFVTTNTVTLDHAGLSTQDPWLTATQTTTSGNNVDAYADISGSDGFDASDVRPGITAPNAFEYDFASFDGGLTDDGQKHAVVSLFYNNNFLHDWFYDSGFDEAAGNAQVSNFGRGGQENDVLLAEAQDSSGSNNANMSTPQDGGSPKMQMFLWDFLSDRSLTVNGVTNIETLTAAFGASDFDVTGVLSLVDDGTVPLEDGCEAITNDLTGLVAIIDRGACNFTVKVKNAQNQGAIGVIMVNNVTGGVIAQGGSDDTVTIPSMMVSLEKGGEIKAELAADTNLQARLFNQPKPIDGTLDNGIVAHEWGHYLSNRLVGNANGLSNNQGRSMGEGWSDFVALLLTAKESDNLLAGNENYQGVYAASTFVGDAYFGIRRAPYTTDMNKNALTFKHIENGVSLPLTHPVAFGISGANNSQVHATGEIWANALWESYVGLINKPEYSFVQAQQAMKDYLVASLKLTPNSPTILEARDALLAAALANNAQDFAIIRGAFSKRGMGAAAIAPDRLSLDHSDVVEDFTQGTDLSFQLQLDPASLTSNTCDNDGVLDVDETASFILTFKSHASGSIPAFNVNLSSSDDVTFSADSVAVGGMSAFAQTSSQTFQMALNSANTRQNISLTATLSEIGAAADDFIEPAAVSINLQANFDLLATRFNDDMSFERASLNDWLVNFDNNITPFVISNEAWHGEDSGSAGSSTLITPVIRVASSGAFSIDFDHFYFFESSDDGEGGMDNWDAGVIEISVDGGNYVDVVDFGASLLETYNGTVEPSNTELGGRQAYTFTRDPNSQNLSANSITFADGLVNGKDIQIRFRIGTDDSVGDFGWQIDNVVVNNAATVMFSSEISEDNVCVSENAPVVNAGEDILLVLRDDNTVNVNLLGTASDADGDNLTLNWRQLTGATVSINNPNSATADFSIAKPSSDIQLSFELTADDGELTSSDRVLVDIRLNQAPSVLAAGGSVNEGEIFSLTATSSDNEGDTLTFSWLQTAGPTVTLSDTTVIDPSFTAPEVAADTDLVFALTANDGSLDSSISTATVTVINQPSPPASTPPPPPSSGGGGSWTLSWLILIGLLRRNCRVETK